MTTAIDSNVLMDVVFQTEPFWSTSWDKIQAASLLGPLIICDAVYAEMVPLFHAQASLDDWLDQFGIGIEPTGREAAYLAGFRWGQYRAAGGPRTRVLPDFLIGAHALVRANRFLTRDTGYFSTYFPELVQV